MTFCQSCGIKKPRSFQFSSDRKRGEFVKTTISTIFAPLDCLFLDPKNKPLKHGIYFLAKKKTLKLMNERGKNIWSQVIQGFINTDVKDPTLQEKTNLN